MTGDFTALKTVKREFFFFTPHCFWIVPIPERLWVIYMNFFACGLVPSSIFHYRKANDVHSWYQVLLQDSFKMFMCIPRLLKCTVSQTDILGMFWGSAFQSYQPGPLQREQKQSRPDQWMIWAWLSCVLAVWRMATLTCNNSSVHIIWSKWPGDG